MLSIITPIFNGAHFIRENIESIQKLSIPYEHIIIDGGSTDGTLDILKEYQDLRIVHQKEKTGMYGAIDMGFSIAKGEYICWVNCDDRVIPKGYDMMYHHAINKKLDFTCSDCLFHYTHSNKLVKVRGTRFAKYFLKNGYFPFSQPSVIYTKFIYNKVNGLNYDFFKIVGDMDLFHRMSLLTTARFGYLPKTTSIFLKHGNSLGDNNTQKGIDEQRTFGILPKSTLINKILLVLTRKFQI